MVLRIGSMLGGRYEIIGRIGSGGMSDVYKGRDVKLNRFIAVKVLKDEYASDRTFVEKFRLEAQAAACLSNPNIVNIYDVGDEMGIYYIIMELIEGITLKRYIERKGKLGVREAIEVAMQVTHGLIAAHSEKIVHRDIKPQNIMISKEGKIKVTDFGIARMASTKTISASTMGSVHYISPEQARGGFCDERADIYSLGITLYEMLTGKVPYEGENPVSVALLHIQSEMVPPSKYEPSIPLALEKIIYKCTQKKPDERYANASLLLEDLKRVIAAPAAPVEEKKETEAPEILAVASHEAAKPVAKNEIKKNEIRHESKEKAGIIEKTKASVSKETELIDERERRFEKGVTIAGIAVAAIIVIVVTLIALNVVGVLDFGGGQIIIDEERQIEIPDLRGMTYEKANEMLSEYGITIKATYGINSNYNEGQIYEQDVEEGTLVTAGAVINVVINVGENSLTIPDDLSDYLPETVVEKLNQAGFTNINSEYHYEYSDSIKEGKVIGVDPASGSEVAPDAVITIIVSKGPSHVPVKVPNVVGYTIENAKTVLSSKKLKYKIKEEYNDDVDEGMVVSQSPDDSEEVSEGTTITLVVSLGQGTFKMPNLTGLTEEMALLKLTELGLEINNIDFQFSSDDMKDRIIGQDPVYEAEVKKGDKVDLYIGQGPELSTEATSEGASEPSSESSSEATTEVPTEVSTEATSEALIQ